MDNLRNSNGFLTMRIFLNRSQVGMLIKKKLFNIIRLKIEKKISVGKKSTLFNWIGFTLYWSTTSLHFTSIMNNESGLKWLTKLVFFKQRTLISSCFVRFRPEISIQTYLLKLKTYTYLCPNNRSSFKVRNIWSE